MFFVELGPIFPDHFLTAILVTEIPVIEIPVTAIPVIEIPVTAACCQVFDWNCYQAA